ncbi:MAG: YjbH domain-containing protein [Bacteroidales bacterium]|nr:YjbH domain-containing protein [Bacteroidales bacterium]
MDLQVKLHHSIARHIKTFFIVTFFMSNISTTSGQSLTGLTGMLNTPSAEMQKEGTFYMGVNYINKESIQKYGNAQNNCLAYYFDLTFLPFLEVNFRSTRLLNREGGGFTVDRMISLRARLLKERKYVPSVVVGAHDLYTSSTGNGNQYFGTMYITGSKKMYFNKNEIGITLGYGLKPFRNNQFKGIFGGVSYRPSFLHQLTLMAEYDSQTLNIGFSVLFIKHLYVFTMAQGLKDFSGGIAYKIFLIKN